MRRSRPGGQEDRRMRLAGSLGILRDSRGAPSRCRCSGGTEMKTMPRIALALSAFAAVGAGAQTFYSGQADQDRRERNREEALAAYHNGSSTTTDRYGHTTA